MALHWLINGTSLESCPHRHISTIKISLHVTLFLVEKSPQVLQSDTSGSSCMDRPIGFSALGPVCIIASILPVSYSKNDEIHSHAIVVTHNFQYFLFYCLPNTAPESGR